MMNSTPSCANRLALIGAGKMAEALARGWYRAGATRLVASDPEPARRALFAEQFGAETTDDNAAAARGADVVVLAVKPQVMEAALDSLRGALAPGALVLSIAAGVPCARIEAGLGGSPRVVRAMPNTPALVGAGVTAICAGAHAEANDLARAERLLAPAGTVVRVAEPDMDAVTALSGSGPAYVFYCLEAWLAEAAALGLAPATARALAFGMLSGAARLAEETGLEPAELRRQVTSKGGTTEAAVRVLDAAGVHETLRAAVRAARDRARELAKS